MLNTIIAIAFTLSQVWIPLPNGDLELQYDGTVRIILPQQGDDPDPPLGYIVVPDDYPTIQAGVDAAQIGDTIVVLGGTESDPVAFEERVTFADVPAGVTLKAEPRRSVVVKGFNTGWAGVGLTIQGFVVTNPETKFAVLIDSDEVTFADNYVYDVDYSIYVNGWPVGGVIRDNRIYKCGMGLFVRGYEWLVENNEVERLIDRGHDTDYSRAFGPDHVFRGNWFHGTYKSEIGSRHPDGFQTFTNNGPGATNFLFEQNVVEGFGQGVILAAVDTPGGVSGTVQNNVFVGNYLDAPVSGAYGILAHYDVVDLVVVNNYFIDINHHGVFLRFGAQGRIQYNVFYNAGSNYHADAASSLVGGYNVLDQESYPRYLEETDRVVPGLVITFVPPTGVPFDITDTLIVGGLN